MKSTMPSCMTKAKVIAGVIKEQWEGNGCCINAEVVASVIEFDNMVAALTQEHRESLHYQYEFLNQIGIQIATLEDATWAMEASFQPAAMTPILRAIAICPEYFIQELRRINQEKLDVWAKTAEMQGEQESDDTEERSSAPGTPGRSIDQEGDEVMSGIPNTPEHEQEVLAAIADLGGFKVVYDDLNDEVDVRCPDEFLLFSIDVDQHKIPRDILEDNEALYNWVLKNWADEIAEGLLQI